MAACFSSDSYNWSHALYLCVTLILMHTTLHTPLTYSSHPHAHPHIHTHTLTSIHTHPRIHKHIPYIHTHTLTFAHTHTLTSTCTPSHSHTHTLTSSHTPHIHTHPLTSTHTPSHPHTHPHFRTHALICTHTLIYTHHAFTFKCRVWETAFFTRAEGSLVDNVPSFFNISVCGSVPAQRNSQCRDSSICYSEHQDTFYNLGSSASCEVSYANRQVQLVFEYSQGAANIFGQGNVTVTLVCGRNLVSWLTTLCSVTVYGLNDLLLLHCGHTHCYTYSLSQCCKLGMLKGAP